MNFFQSDQVKLAYLDEGAGLPVILIHGFASNIATNWVNTGWVGHLKKAGYRVIAIDNRGHGQSEKLYDPEAYAAPLMAEDIRRLLDHLEFRDAFILGYSMGARISAFLTLSHPQRVKRVVFAGLGINMVRGLGGAGPIAKALEAPSLDEVTNETARTFREFAESTGSDLKALAACIRATREKITRENIATISKPVLVVVGTEDVIGGSAEELAKLIPNGEHVDLVGRDHMKAVGDRVFKEAVVEFFARDLSYE